MLSEDMLGFTSFRSKTDAPMASALLCESRDAFSDLLVAEGLALLFKDKAGGLFVPMSPPLNLYLSFFRHHSGVKPVVGQSIVTIDASITQRGILITTECEYGLIHLFRVKHPEVHKQVKILHRQTGDSLEQT